MALKDRVENGNGVDSEALVSFFCHPAFPSAEVLEWFGRLPTEGKGPPMPHLSGTVAMSQIDSEDIAKFLVDMPPVRRELLFVQFRLLSKLDDEKEQSEQRVFERQIICESISRQVRDEVKRQAKGAA